MKVYPPKFSNIVALLTGNIELMDSEKCVNKYCNEIAKKVLKKNIDIQRYIEYYFKLAEYVCKDSSNIMFMEIYEPLILLIECGGDFILSYNELEIRNAAVFPLRRWYEFFKNTKEINIDKFYLQKL